MGPLLELTEDHHRPLMEEDATARHHHLAEGRRQGDMTPRLGGTILPQGGMEEDQGQGTEMRIRIVRVRVRGLVHRGQGHDRFRLGRGVGRRRGEVVEAGEGGIVRRRRRGVEGEGEVRVIPVIPVTRGVGVGVGGDMAGGRCSVENSEGGAW